MDENILLNISFNNDDIKDAVKNISAGRQAIDQLIEANKKLVEQGQKNSLQYTQNQEAIKKLNGEVANNSKIVQANTQAVNVNSNSIEALKKRNSELLKERNKVDISTAEGVKKVQQLNAEYDKNSKVIAENSTKVEQQRFNIGNYQSALNGISPAVGNFAGNVGKASEASGSLTSGIFGMVKASLAFVATPLGAIIAAVVVGFKLLSAYLTGTQEGMDKLTSFTRPVLAVFDALLGVVQNLGGKAFKELAKAFSDPKQAVIDLGNAIVDNVINRFKALALIGPAIAKIFKGDISGGFKDLGNAVIQGATGITNAIDKVQDAANSLGKVIDEAAEKGKRLDELQKQIEKGELAQIVRSKELNLLIKQNKALVEDETQSYKDRIAAAIKAKELQAEALNNELSLLDKQIEKTKIQQSLNDTLLEDKKELQELIAKKLELEATATEQGIEFSKKIVEIRRKQAADELAISKNIQELQLGLLADGFDKQKQVLESAASDRISALKGSEEQIAQQTLLINENLQQDLSELKAKYDADADAREQDRIKANEEFLKAALDEELKTYTDHVQALINAKKEEYLQGTISKQEYEQEISDVELASLQMQQSIKEQFGEQDIALAGKILDYKIALGEKEVAIKQQQEQQKLNAIQDTLGVAASAFNKQSVAFKVLASAQTLVNTYQSATAAFNSLANIPYVGTILGALAAAAAVASGLSNVAKINSVQLPKLEDGGIIDIGGRRHSQGGEDVSVGGRKVANVEAGEKMVILKRGSDKLLRNLSNINQMVGGIDFYNNRGPKSYLADGGFVARSANARASNLQIVNLSDSLKNVTLEVSVTDIEKKSKQINRAKATSELS